MTFRTKDRTRKVLINTGVAGAPLVVALHCCPELEEIPLLPPAEHAEQHGFDPSLPRSLQSQMVSSTTTDVPFVPSYDGNDVVRLNWDARRRAYQTVLASTTQMNANGGVLWFASTQVDRQEKP